MNLQPGPFPPQTRSSSPFQRWQPRHATLRLRLFVYAVAIDVMCIVASFVVAPVLHDAPFASSRLQLLLGALLPVYLLTALNAGAYIPALAEDRFRSAARGVRAFLFALSFLLVGAFSLKASSNFSRLTFTIGSTLSVISLAAARYLFAKHAERLIGGNPFSIVIICDGDQLVPPGGYTVLVAAEAGFDPESDDPDMYDRLAKALGSVDRVVVKCAAERRLVWAHALKGAHVQGEIVVPELADFAPLGVSRHGELSTLIVSNGPLRLTDRVVKRGFDVAVAATALLFFSPMLVAVAALIKLDSTGPVFFRQTRIGRGNEMFEMLKFRSMKVDDCDGAGDRSTSRDDDRITRVGRIIRMTSIDELPQLFNVLRGDMSIVGPRPHALGSRAADKLFWEIDTRYWHRHAAKPGLTGLAQIRGYRGATVHEHDLVNRLQADLEYLDKWSIWKDLLIILRTFGVLLHRNAY
ncbi:sugar transferase [Sphingomonas koreensis]|nr:sugar transferase [Sphingomonas koreensis]